jgi:AraC-like DNA-binding protein
MPLNDDTPPNMPQAPTEPSEHAAVWIDRDLEDLEILRATYRRHSFAPHAHDTYAFGLIEAGAGGFAARGTSYVVPTATLFVIHPGEVHNGYAATDAGWSYRVLYPAPKMVQRVLSEVSDRSADLPFFTQPVIADLELVQLVRRLHKLLEQRSDRLERETYLRWVIMAFAARHAATPPPKSATSSEPRAVAIAREYLDAHAADPISLHQLADLVNLHPAYLVRIFHRAVGLPPHAYLIQARVRAARLLLRAGLPPAIVASSVGFADQSHLTRHFRRIVGVTPARFAQRSKTF